MVQRTLVLKLDRERQERLAQEVARADFERRTVEHARFQVRAPGVVATLYRSGKLVVQGAEAELFVERFLGEPVPAPRARSPKEVEEESGRPLVGGDESGKGDFFGPLVVAAVRLEPGDAAKLREGGLVESKVIADERALRLGAALRERFPHALRVVEPPDYNRLHRKEKNVAVILANLYHEVVGELAEPGLDVLIDQFSLSRARLEDVFADLPVRLRQMHRAERTAAVAAASVVARAAFLERLRELSGEFGVDLHKGAGTPTIAAARRFLSLHPPEALDRVAKTHFKTMETLGLPRA